MVDLHPLTRERVQPMFPVVEDRSNRSVGRGRVGRTIVFVAAALVLVAVGIRLALPRPLMCAG